MAKISVVVHSCPSALTPLWNYLPWYDLLWGRGITAVIAGSDACIIILGRRIDGLRIRLITFLLRPRELLCPFFYVRFTIFMSFIRSHLNSITIRCCLGHGPISLQNIIFFWLAFYLILLIFFRFIELVNFNWLFWALISAVLLLKSWTYSWPYVQFYDCQATWQYYSIFCRNWV
jgi:hypothetical protein